MFNELEGNPIFPAQQEVMQEVVEAPIQEEYIETPEKEVAAPKEAMREYNIRVMRERAEQAERRNQELEKLIQAQSFQPQAQHQQQYAQQPEAFDLAVDDESYIEGKHLKKYSSVIKSEFQQMRQQLEQYKQESALASATARLKSTISDFDQVVNDDNLKSLRSIYPEDYASVMANPDVYSKAKTAYNMIKSYGLAENYEKETKRIEVNRSKPRSVSSVSPQSSDSPLSRVGDYDRRVLTKEQKEENMKNVRLYKSMR